MNTSSLSIVIPTYKRIDSLISVLNDISLQSVLPSHVYIVDDDPSSQLLNFLPIDLFSSLGIKLFYSKNIVNKGVIENTIYACSLASTEYIAIFSDDDIHEKDFIHYSINYLDDTLEDYYMPGFVNMTSSKVILPQHQTNKNILSWVTKRSVPLVRVLLAYLIPSPYGLCNLFFSVYRRKSLDSAIRNISMFLDGNHNKFLFFDSLVSLYSLYFLKGHFFNRQQLILVVGNHKYYNEGSQKTNCLQRLTSDLFPLLITIHYLYSILPLPSFILVISFTPITLLFELTHKISRRFLRPVYPDEKN